MNYQRIRQIVIKYVITDIKFRGYLGPQIAMVSLDGKCLHDFRLISLLMKSNKSLKENAKEMHRHDQMTTQRTDRELTRNLFTTKLDCKDGTTYIFRQPKTSNR